MYAITAEAIVDRLQQVLGAPNDAALAKMLGEKPTTVSSWRRRDSRPYSICVDVAVEHGVSLDWLLRGQGEMRPSPEAAATAAGTLPGGLDGHERRVAALLDLLSQLTPSSIEAVLSDCFARATTAQQLDDLRQAVADLADSRKKAG